MIIDTRHQEHKVFKQLSEYSDFYEGLSFSVFGFVSSGTSSIFNIDSYMYSSIQGTLDSIREILLKCRINDAYALLRKYHDSVIINTYSILYLEANFSLDNFVVKKIDDWVKGKERLPEFRVMSNYIRKTDRLLGINNLLHKDMRYKAIRDRCNDHTHYNFYRNVLLNDNNMYSENRIAILDAFSKDLENIFILHFAYIFTINDHYMISSDYIDCLDMGLIPEEGSQFYVAPPIQNIFDEVIKKNRMDIAIELKNNTAMKLE